jgi:hypothetical protein
MRGEKAKKYAKNNYRSLHFVVVRVKKIDEVLVAHVQ